MAQSPRRKNSTGGVTAVGWYARYHELQNRHDRLREEGRTLPPDEEAERVRLAGRLCGEVARAAAPTLPPVPREVAYAPGLVPPPPVASAEIRYAPGLEPPARR